MGEARAIVEQMLEAINAHDMEAAAKTCASDCEFQLPGLPQADVKQWTQFSDAFFNAFPDGRFRPSMIAEADGTVVVESRWTGTNSAPFAAQQGEIPATGRAIDLRACIVLRVEGGLIASHHGYFDQVELLSQLGLMPEPAHA
jgi:steroid delta-isomerase-like uncharacterized protein